MSFSALLGVVSRASGFSATFWPAAVHAGSPSCVAASVAPRALATTTWASRWKGSSCRHRNGKPSQQQQQQLMWCSNAVIHPSSTSTYDQGRVAASAASCCRVARRSLSVMSASGGAAGEGVGFVETEAAQRRNDDLGCVAFVTGANRGIGLEVTRQLLSKTKGELLATLTLNTSEGGSYWCIDKYDHRYDFYELTNSDASTVCTYSNIGRPTATACGTAVVSNTKRNIYAGHTVHTYVLERGWWVEWAFVLRGRLANS